MPLLRRGVDAGPAGAIGHIDGRGFTEIALAIYCTAHDKVVATPPVVGTIAIGRQGATEVRGGERGDLVFHAHFHGRVVKCGHGGTDPAQ